MYFPETNLRTYLYSSGTLKPSGNTSKSIAHSATFFCIVSAVSDGEREDLRARAPKRLSVTLGDPEKLTRSSVQEQIPPIVLPDSALTPGLSTTCIPLNLLAESAGFGDR